MNTKKKGSVAAEPQHLLEGSNQDYARRPFESIPAWVGRVRRQASTEAAAHGLRLVPETSTGRSEQELRDLAANIIQRAMTQQRGAWSLVALKWFPPVHIPVDYDGEGGVWINDAAHLTAAGRHFVDLLHMLGKDRVHDGNLEGCEPAPIFFEVE